MIGNGRMQNFVRSHVLSEIECISQAVIKIILDFGRQNQNCGKKANFSGSLKPNPGYFACFFLETRIVNFNEKLNEERSFFPCS